MWAKKNGFEIQVLVNQGSGKAEAFNVDLEDDITIPMPYTTIAFRERRKNVLQHFDNVSDLSSAEIGRFEPLENLDIGTDLMLSKFMSALHI